MSLEWFKKPEDWVVSWKRISFVHEKFLEYFFDYENDVLTITGDSKNYTISEMYVKTSALPQILQPVSDEIKKDLENLLSMKEETLRIEYALNDIPQSLQSQIASIPEMSKDQLEELHSKLTQSYRMWGIRMSDTIPALMASRAYSGRYGQIYVTNESHLMTW